MNPKLRNILIVSGIIVGAVSAYVLYKWSKKDDKSEKDTESGANPVNEDKVTADAKSNRLTVSR